MCPALCEQVLAPTDQSRLSFCTRDWPCGFTSYPSAVLIHNLAGLAFFAAFFFPGRQIIHAGVPPYRRKRALCPL